MNLTTAEIDDLLARAYRRGRDAGQTAAEADYLSEQAADEDAPSADLSEWGVRMHQAQEQIKEQAQQLGEVAAENLYLTRRVARQSDTIEAQGREVDALITEHDELKAELADWKTKHEHLFAANDYVGRCLQEMEASRDRAIERAEEWKGKHDALSAANALTCDRLQAVEAERDKVQMMNERQKAMLVQLDSGGLRAQVARQVEEIVGLRAERDEAQKSYALADALLDIREKEKAELIMERDQLKRDYAIVCGAFEVREQAEGGGKSTPHP